jgi:hypothetical protein
MSRAHGRRVWNSAALAVAFVAYALVACAAEAPIRIADTVQVKRPANWRLEPSTLRNGPVVLTRGGAEGAPLARVTFTVETRRDHEDALRRLADVARESNTPPRWFPLGGWPALERTQEQPLPATGAAQAPGVAGGPAPDATPWRMTTLAIAAGSLLVRAEVQLAPTADAALREEALRLARSVSLPSGADKRQTTRELEELQRTGSAPPPAVP